MIIPLRRPAALLTFTFALAASGCSLVSEYNIPDGAKTQRGYRSVAGAVHIGRAAEINGAKTVAGSIDVGERATTRSLRSIAGEIRVGRDAKVEGDVSTIAGNIRLAEEARVTGKVTTVAGTITLSACRVAGAVTITKGSVQTRGPTALPGGIVVRYTRVNEDDPAKIDIGPGADVASIEVEPRAIVDLRISRQAHVGKITGAVAHYYD